MEKKTNKDNDFEIIEDTDEITSKIDKIKRELESCKKDKTDYLTGWQRAKADYINAEKSFVEREKNARNNVEKILMKELLEIVDSFEAAFENYSEENKWSAGIKNIFDQLAGILKRHGIEKIDVNEALFDPHFHDAVLLEETGNQDEDGKITAILKNGYLIRGEVLRPTQVKVAQYKHINNQ